MREFISFRSRGQTIVLVALAAVALLALVALAVDGGNAYATRRQAQNAADGAAIAGTWMMVDISGFNRVARIVRQVNTYAQANGVPDTNPDPNDWINDNVQSYFVDISGNRVSPELHNTTVIPSSARGVEVVTTITRTTFFARAIGVQQIAASALATAVYEPDGGVLPIAVNEYWAGSGGKCPYANCGIPYSFVRNPDAGVPSPFTKVADSPEEWKKNTCSDYSVCCDPDNNNVCQGAYEGYGENYGRAFAILGAEAKPNIGSNDSRSFVHLDYRYDALDPDGNWHILLNNDVWQDPTPQTWPAKKNDMEIVIEEGGYTKVPIPGAMLEPPPEHLEEWGFCWGGTHPGCFNSPSDVNHSPYRTVVFLPGADADKEAKAMYESGRFPPGSRIVIMVYNGVSSDQWGGSNKDDAAQVVGYFGAIIVGYGNNFKSPCNGTPGDWQSFQSCITGQPNTVYAIAGPKGQLRLNPQSLIDEFLPKRITLIK